MQDLVVCVGESCHQNGAEIVVKTFKDIIDTNQLNGSVALKGSFCIGECCEMGEWHQKDMVSVRLGSQVMHVDPEEAARAFDQEVLPKIAKAQED